MASVEKVFLPIPPPPTIYKENPHAHLSSSEQSMYDEVLGHFTRIEPEYTIPNTEKGELTDEEKFWLSRECLLRYVTFLVIFHHSANRMAGIFARPNGRFRLPFKDLRVP